MPSPTKIAALRIARSLKPAEQAMNEALMRMLAVGQAVIAPRADGTVHPLEGDAAVQLVGVATTRMFQALGDIRQMHTELRATAVRHDIVDEGVIDTPPETTPRGEITPFVQQQEPIAA